MGSLTEKLTFSVSSSHYETALKYFTKPKLFSAITTE